MRTLRPSLWISLSCSLLFAAVANAHDAPSHQLPDPPAAGVEAPAAAPSTGPVAVGAPITMKKPVPIAKLAKSPEKFVGKTILIEGTVKEVCQGKGCWVEVEDAKGVSFMAKSLDDSILLPKTCAGRKVVVQGVVTRLMPKGHDHAAGHDEEHAGHACPTPSFVLSTQGAKLVATP
jgi:hypothetical protein